MVKFGKEFRKNIIHEYENKYFNYKEYKKLIKSMLNSNENNLNTKIDTFIQKLNTDLKKIFIYFVKDERILYKKINSHLYRRENYKDYQSQEFFAELFEIYGISNNSLNLSSYVYYNIKAIFKILKKFNKKIVKDPNKDIKNEYIFNNLKEENSDLLYLYKFKIIDEVNILIEDLIKTLKKSFRFHNSLLGKVNNTSSKQEMLNQNNSEYYQKFKDYYNKIKLNIKQIDKNAFDFKLLFLPWNDYLKNKDELSNKLIKIRNNSINSVEITEKDISYISDQNLMKKIFFSKENNINLICTLIHTILYMFTFSIIIPNNYNYLINEDGFKDKGEKTFLFYALIMVSVPVGTIISFTYETTCVKNSTKKPIILSLSLQILGNILYIIEVEKTDIHIIQLLCLSRIFIGLSAIRTTNKMYLANFLPKNEIKRFIIYFDVCTMFGLGSGFIINLFFIKNDKLDVIKFNIGNIICAILSILLLIFVIFFFKEAKSKNFLKEISDIEDITDDNSMKNDIEKDSKMVNDINTQLGDFNKKNKYDDTNLVTRTVFENITSAKKGLKSLIKSFIVFTTIVFTTKFINEFFFIITPLYCFDKNNEVKDNLIYPCIILGITCYIMIFIEIIFYKISKIANEKTILFIFYITLLILNFSKLFFIIFYEKNSPHIIKNTFFIIAISFSIILSRFIEKASSLFFSNIIPNEFNIFGINGNICINTISHIGRVIAAFSPFLLTYMDFHKANLIYYSIMTFFSLISFIIFFIYYKDLRIKAISRIIHQQKPNLEVVTEI